MQKRFWSTLFFGIALLITGAARADVADQRADHQCGPSFGGAKCGTDRCCSQFNWCGGANEAHCSSARGYGGQFDGPKNVPDQRPDHQCGPAFGSARCGTDRCCSQFNWCGGTTEAHCSSARGYGGQFDGPRSAATPTPPPRPPVAPPPAPPQTTMPDQRADHHCGPSFGGAKCGADRCCSQFNWCGGANEAHCSSARGYQGQFDGPKNVPDQRADHQCGPSFGNAKCGTNRCCSQFNWCGGTNEAHCSSARGYGGQFDGPRQ